MNTPAPAPRSLKTTPKISVKIWRPILNKLDAKMDAACLRRDAYLAKLLAHELPRLDAEVSLPNSPAAHDFTFERLDALDRKLVSIALDPDLAGQLNAICDRKNIVRDAFFNRLFLMLTARPKAVDALFFPDEPKWRTQVWQAEQHDGPFFERVFYPLEVVEDPFWAIRAGLALYGADAGAQDYDVPELGTRVRVACGVTGRPEPLPALHTVFFDTKFEDGPDLLGLNCWVADWSIPGHEAQIQHAKALDELLETL